MREIIFDNLLKMNVEGSILILIIMLLRKLMKNNFKKSIIYSLWIVLIIKMLLPFGIESSISIYNLFPHEKIIGYKDINLNQLNIRNNEVIDFEKKLSQGEKNIEINTAIDSKGFSNAIDKVDEIENENIKIIQSQQNLKFQNIKKYLVEFWFLGVISLSFITLIKYIKFIKRINKENIEEDLMLESIFSEASKIIKQNKNPKIKLTKLVSSPMLIGFINPVILIPDKLMESLSDKEIKFILMHELTHLKRKDVIVIWLFKIVKVFNFYNPLMIISERLMKEDCEEACDEYVLSKIKKEENLDYGNTIIKVIENITFKDTVIGGATMASNKKDLKSRIISIKDNRHFNKKSMALGVLVIIVLVIIGISTGEKDKEININSDESLTLKVYSEISGSDMNAIGNKVIENKEDIENIITKLKSFNLKETNELKEDPIRIEILSNSDSIFVYKDFIQINNDKYRSSEDYFNEVLALYKGLEADETFYRENEIEGKSIFEVYPDLRKEMDNILEFHGYKVGMNSLTYEVGKLPEDKHDDRNGVNISSDIDEIIRFSNSFNYNNGYGFSDSEEKTVHIIKSSIENIDESKEELEMGRIFMSFAVNGEIKGYYFFDDNEDTFKLTNYLTYYPKESINSSGKLAGFINGINFARFAYLNDVEITKFSTEELSKPTLSYKAYLHTIEVSDGKILVYEYFDKKAAEIEIKGIGYLYNYKEEDYLFDKDDFMNYNYINNSDTSVILYTGNNEEVISMIEKFQTMKYTTLWN